MIHPFNRRPFLIQEKELYENVVNRDEDQIFKLMIAFMEAYDRAQAVRIRVWGVSSKLGTQTVLIPRVTEFTSFRDSIEEMQRNKGVYAIFRQLKCWSKTWHAVKLGQWVPWLIIECSWTKGGPSVPHKTFWTRSQRPDFWKLHKIHGFSPN